MCIADDDATCLRDMIKPRLRNAGSGKSDNTTDLVRMQAHILEGLGRTAELETLLEKFHSLDRGLCVMYLDMLKHADQDKARQAARDATGAFPGDVRIMGAALELYPKAGPDYVPALRDLFAATGDWRYFFKLGEVSTDWHAEVATTASNLLRKGAPGTAVDAYLKGGMAGDAMDLLESLGMSSSSPRTAQSWPRAIRIGTLPRTVSMPGDLPGAEPEGITTSAPASTSPA